MITDSERYCPYCDYPHQTRGRVNSELHVMGNMGVHSFSYVCSNIKCGQREIFIEAGLNPQKTHSQSNNCLDVTFEKVIFSQRIHPQDAGGKSKYKTPEIPEPIFNDYDEACKIAQLSPRASATLSRRCLQHMIRQKFGVTPDSLENEIKAIKDLNEPEIVDALHAIRQLGNLGAHPEKDVNIVVDISQEEAREIIHVIETALHEWFIVPEERKQRLAELKRINKQKQDERKGQTT